MATIELNWFAMIFYFCDCIGKIVLICIDWKQFEEYQNTFVFRCLRCPFYFTTTIQCSVKLQFYCAAVLSKINITNTYAKFYEFCLIMAMLLWIKNDLQFPTNSTYSIWVIITKKKKIVNIGIRIKYSMYSERQKKLYIKKNVCIC